MLRFTREQVATAMLAILMFSATALYTAETKLLYIGITAIMALLALWAVIKDTRRLWRMLCSRFVGWLTLVLLLVMVDAAFRTQFGKLNYDFIAFSWGSLMIIWILLDKNQDAKAVAEVFVSACEAAAVAVCVYMLIREAVVLLQEEGVIRLGDSLSGNVNTVCIHLCLYSFGILYRYLKTGRIRHVLILAVVLLCAMLTGSKQVLLSFPILAFIYIFYGGFHWKRMLCIGLLVVCMAAALFFIPALYWSLGFRILNFLGFGYSHSTTVRLELIQTSWQCFLQKPIFGGGYLWVASMSENNFYTHSNYLELLTSYGLAGLFVYYSIYVCAFVRLRKHRKSGAAVILPTALLINDLMRDIAMVSYTSGAMTYISLLFAFVYIAKLEQGKAMPPFYARFLRRRIDTAENKLRNKMPKGKGNRDK